MTRLFALSLAALALATAALAVPPAEAATRTRSASRQVNPDGSASRQRAVNASGARGTVQRNLNASRDGEGGVDRTRSATATSATTGNSVQANTSYSRDDGNVQRSRSVTCYDASGAAIACR